MTGDVVWAWILPTTRSKPIGPAGRRHKPKCVFLDTRTALDSYRLQLGSSDRHVLIKLLMKAHISIVER